MQYERHGDFSLFFWATTTFWFLEVQLKTNSKCSTMHLPLYINISKCLCYQSDALQCLKLKHRQHHSRLWNVILSSHSFEHFCCNYSTKSDRHIFLLRLLSTSELLIFIVKKNKQEKKKKRGRGIWRDKERDKVLKILQNTSMKSWKVKTCSTMIKVMLKILDREVHEFHFLFFFFLLCFCFKIWQPQTAQY